MVNHQNPRRIRLRIILLVSLGILTLFFASSFYLALSDQENKTAVSFQLTYGAKGIGDATQNSTTIIPGVNLTALDYDWYYDWSFINLPSRNNDPKFVRMVWCDFVKQRDTYGNVHTIADVARDDYENGRSGRVWLVFNEPDAPGVQCGEVFADDPVGAAHHYSAVYDMIKENDPNARVFAGGLLWLNSQETRFWWWDFIDTLAVAGELHKIEGVHIHLYPTITNEPVRGVYGDPAECADASCLISLVEAANDWYQQMHLDTGLGDRPIWITETGWLFCEDATESWIEDEFMQPLTQWFADDAAWPYPDIPTNPGYETIAWYVTHDPDWFPCTYLLDKTGASGKATKLGQFWNQFMQEE